MLGSDRWRDGTIHTFTGVLKELHALAQRTGRPRADGQALYQRLSVLLHRDPGLARLLGRRDFEVLLTLLEADPRAWPYLGPAVAATLRAEEGDGGQRAWLTEAHAALLARGATTSLLQGPSQALPADLYLLETCVTQPAVDDLVVVVNTARLLMKQAMENEWAGGGGPLLPTLDLLHTWRRPLVRAVPGWGDSVRQWCLLLGQQPETLPMLDKTLLLFRDYLHEAPPHQATPWLEVVVTVTAQVHAAWRWAAAPALLVTLSSATAGLTTTLMALLDALPQGLQQDQLRATLTQLLTLLDERGRPEACQLPGDTLHAVTTCACHLLDLADPTLLLWAASTFSTPTRVLQAVEDAPEGGGDNPVVVEEARLVTAVVRALSPFSLRVLLLALRKLGSAAGVGKGEVPLVGVVADWFCSVVGSGLRLDPAAFLLPPDGTHLLQVLSQHFHRRHHAPLLQVAAFALLGGDTGSLEARRFGECLLEECVSVYDAATRGACTLLAFLCCPRPAFMHALTARPPGQVKTDVAACQHDAAAAHPKYQELVAALARQVTPLLQGGALPPHHTPDTPH